MPWMLVAGDFTPLGGMDRANHALARYLARRDEVHLVTHRAWPDLAALPRVSVHAVPRPLGSHLLGGPLLARAGVRVWSALEASGVRAVVNGGNCPLPTVNWVHYLHAAYTPDTPGSAARRLKSSLAARHDLASERTALEVADLVICNSRRTRDDVVERIGIEPGRVRVVYYGSDPDRFSPVDEPARRRAKAALGCRGDRPLVGFVGALGDRRKAFDRLFEAWTGLCRSPAWDADLLVVGDGAELPAWRRRAATRGVSDRIRFMGFRDDIPDVLAALDGLAHPARYEAYGLAVHEAICRGVPAIVSARAGVAEQFPAELGDLLVQNVEDAGELAERLSAWRRHLERWRERVVPLSARLRARTWDTMACDIAAEVGPA
jgi:glycosyltransferase involved in cell wall biosynthesis